MSSLVLSGDTSGTVTLSVPAVSGSNTLTIQAGTGTNSMNTLATAVASTSGTSIDFTGIPAWAKKITLMLAGVSTSGTSIIQVQLGDSGGIENTGYLAQAWAATGTGVATSGVYLSIANAAANVWIAQLVISNYSGNSWLVSGISNITQASNVGYQIVGSKTLSDVLTQLRVTTVNGTDTFDAGSINILYEG
jgi:hypothetical protein